jgi:hypothetical protein
LVPGARRALIGQFATFEGLKSLPEQYSCNWNFIGGTKRKLCESREFVWLGIALCKKVLN